jgi:hypothetical protein
MASKQARRDTPVLDATNESIEAATHLDAKVDAGAIETLRALALKVDMMDAYLEELAVYATEHRLRPPSQDNVSIPTYLKFAESMGLTPAGRAKLTDGKAAKPPTGAKKTPLASVSDIPRPA